MVAGTHLRYARYLNTVLTQVTSDGSSAHLNRVSRIEPGAVCYRSKQSRPSREWGDTL
jgi:hypothetical protein